MLLSDVVQTSRSVAETRARSEKIELLSGCVGRMARDEIEIGVSFLMGELRQGKIGLGYAVVRDLSPPHAVQQPKLTLSDVDLAFSEIASISGTGSAKSRAERLSALFSRATTDEQGFLKRLIVGELRQGALEGILVDAVARAAGVAASSVRRALMLNGDFRRVAHVAMVEGDSGLRQFRIQVFRPLAPMLAQPSPSLAETFSGGRPLALEFKLDGARIQVHRSGSDVRVFTRNLNDVTARVPEVVESVKKLPARELILDGEVLALDADQRPHTFQTTMRRFGRRLDVHALLQELPIKPFFFDCLYADGEDFVDSPEGERFDVLSRVASPELRVERLVTADTAQADEFLEKALALGHEGLMAKAIEAPYEAGRRGASWLKIKLAHTLDLVVLAAEWGSGRRRGWLSNLHLGARDSKGSGFVMLGKTFKGMTDAMLKWQTERLLSLEVSRNDWVVFVRPELVVEVAFDGVQASSQYPGGVALRFARVKRYREDKTAAEADTIDAVKALV